MNQPTRRSFLVVCLAATAAAAAGASCAAPRTAPTPSRSATASLSDREFWELFTRASEPGGSFLSENFVSNELAFQNPIRPLQRVVRTGDAYLGVGPEQNFTYIANLDPGIAIIFDIRRQNAMAQLMYKALFELSPTRAAFLARLLSRAPAGTPARDAGAAELFDGVMAAPRSDSLYRVNLAAVVHRLTRTHGFALDSSDIASIEHVYRTFYDAGADIDYAYSPGRPAIGVYPTLADLQRSTNAEGEHLAFLADERRYQAVRALELRNLVVPIVGDFAGPTAIRAVGAWLASRRVNVGAFYVSNVEQYLFQRADGGRAFYANVATLPTDSTTTFIRSVPRFPAASFVTGGAAVAPQYDVQVRDSGNASIIEITRYSDGRRVTTRSVDTSATRPRSALQVFRALQPPTQPGVPSGPRVLRSALFSGTAPLRETVQRVLSGAIATYADLIASTRTDGAP
ncbi:hypothetical protein J421_5754 (plasmid) [Gemmatirosa kalamazoonensis]|uniref:DUF7790 domain-containing protein n=1 Tax=Gemmatirosa kalamazoonensis TaxID=861299 RepID=W0RQN4_9BACT|nr:hypothetical protein [Gemmatirosa kalamazoonensis]AHG93289.1 hypothetical protein J421_5754 [Gemmatirosa kalamazoonensis]